MTINEWVRNALTDNNNDKEYVRTLYDDICEDLGYTVNQASFEVSIRKMFHVVNEDHDMLSTNVQLKKSLQKTQDTNRIERGTFRDYARLENALTEYNKYIVEYLKNTDFSGFNLKNVSLSKSGNFGIIHITDLHLNELVNIKSNQYDFRVASKRLQKLVSYSKNIFNGFGITEVQIVLTGDLINSDRRLDEMLTMASNRAKATILAVLLLEHVILDLRKDFKVHVTGVSGNESRAKDEPGLSEVIATDNYDYSILQILMLIFRSDKGTNIFQCGYNESIIDFGGKKILIMHGQTQKATGLDKWIQQIKGRYTSQDIHIDYVLFGHIHCLDPEVEVATTSGFIKLKDITKDSIVFGYKNGQVVKTSINNVIDGYHTGKWYKYDNKFIRQSMTDGHNIYTKDDEYLPIKDFIIEKSYHDLVCSASPYYKSDEYDIDDNMLRLLVAICADGSYDGTNDPSTIRFHFKKSRKIGRLTDIITSLGYNISWSRTETGSFKSKEISKELRCKVKELIPDKMIPEWFLTLSTRQISIVCEEIINWDGSRVGRSGLGINSFQYASEKTKEIDIVQTLLLMNGTLSRRLPNKLGTITFNDRLQWKNSSQRYMPLPNITEVVNKQVMCLETDTHNFFIRTENGTVELTGNSTNISDTFARGASLVGANNYSEDGLNLDGRAAQNIFSIVENDIHGIRIDLQNTDNYDGYDIEYKLKEFNTQSFDKLLNYSKVYKV